MWIWSPRVLIPTPAIPPGTARAAVSVGLPPAARSILTLETWVVLAAMSMAPERALKQRRLFVDSVLARPVSLAHQSKYPLPLVPPVLPPTMVTLLASLTMMPTLPAARRVWSQKILNLLRSSVVPGAVICRPHGQTE